MNGREHLLTSKLLMNKKMESNPPNDFCDLNGRVKIFTHLVTPENAGKVFSAHKESGEEHMNTWHVPKGIN